MITAQALCGASAAVIVPSLVALIAENYRGQQQATAIGALGSARAAAGVLAFTIGGIVGTNFGWRPSFGILVAVSALVFLLSFRLKPDKGRPEVQIDFVGVILAAAAMILISFGFNNLNRWGLVLARPGAPFDLLGVSPAPVMILVGVVLGQAFVMWTRRRQEAGKTPLLALEVIGSSQERAAVYAMFSVVALEAMLNFSVPLYIQIVQGRSPLETAIAMMPFNLTVFFTAMLIVKLYTKLTPQQIGRCGFIICTTALLWLAFVVHNDWSTFPVLIGLIAFGIGQGSLVTLVFNVLGHGLAQGARRRRRLAARHDAKPRRRGRHGGGGRVAGRPAQRDHHAQLGGVPVAAVRDPAGSRSRQHQFRQQRPAQERVGAHVRHPGAGRRGGAHKLGLAAARIEDRPPRHGRPSRSWRSSRPAGCRTTFRARCRLIRRRKKRAVTQSELESSGDPHIGSPKVSK